MAERARVLIVTTGGTITMLRDGCGGLSPCNEAADLLGCVPELERVADVEVLPLVNIDSSDMQPSLWLQLAREIYSRMDAYDGFVVTHGTDTLSYTAAALSFMLQELPKPVILTGAQVPLDEIGTDGRMNLINAVRTATADFAEVAVVFGSQIIRGTRAKKMSVFDMQAIVSVKSVPLGNIGLRVRWNGPVRRRGPRRALLQAFLDDNVGLFTVYPGVRPELLAHLAETHDGVVLVGFGAGHIPTQERSLVPPIRAATERGIPIVVCTPCLFGSTQMQLYKVGRAALDAGAIPAADMTPETTLVKLMWVLGQTRDHRTVGSMIQKVYACELDSDWIG
jgi:L-asparaginase